jgi:hypothetical protein
MPDTTNIKRIKTLPSFFWTNCSAAIASSTGEWPSLPAYQIYHSTAKTTRVLWKPSRSTVVTN